MVGPRVGVAAEVKRGSFPPTNEYVPPPGLGRQVRDVSADLSSEGCVVYMVILTAPCGVAKAFGLTDARDFRAVLVRLHTSGRERCPFLPFPV